MAKSSPKVAIAHDYLTQRGGAEKVVLALTRIFPDAEIYTTLYDPEGTYPEFRDCKIHTSGLNRVGLFRRNHRLALPVLPLAARSIKVSADVVIASSSGWAHGFDTNGDTIVYCYSPARWLYQTDTYLGQDASWPKRIAIESLKPFLKVWDRRAAKRASTYLAISTVVRQRIVDEYNIDAEVVPAPHSVDPDAPVAPAEHPFEDGSFFLCVSRLLPYKNVDSVIRAAVQGNHRLVVVGRGPEEQRLRSMAKEGEIVFLQDLSDEQMRFLYSTCKAVVSASYEDFGLTPIEAAVFGKPSLVLRWGGFLDTIAPEVNGVFFDKVDSDAIDRGMNELSARSWDPRDIRDHAQQFSESRFARRIETAVRSIHTRSVSEYAQS
ncbi:glycosyltransferase [Rhodococcus pyridinivorans]|uniref:glycosyltransferase n=1 Tax=Rhodococcus pyridinivorans TaxID=103816 RepID=UPI002164940E|nr:glycosyltransferase [Rhodococcus pyridinivorans]UVT24118.1 glycosyltransferase [Rhodococcus pyridinivorans]